jgi:hypothetical protein
VVRGYAGGYGCVWLFTYAVPSVAIILNIFGLQQPLVGPPMPDEERLARALCIHRGDDPDAMIFLHKPKLTKSGHLLAGQDMTTVACWKTYEEEAAKVLAQMNDLKRKHGG